MEARSSSEHSRVFRYVLPACAALILLGGCSQSRITMSRHEASPSRAMPDIDSALGASDSLGSQIFAEVRPRLSQADMVYRMAAADDPDLQMQSFFSPDVRMARAPKQVIVTGEGLSPALETATAKTPIADDIE